MFDPMCRRFEEMGNHVCDWLLIKILNALWALFWGAVGFCLVVGIPALVKLLEWLLRAACSLTRWLIRVFEERTGLYITHSPFLTFLAWFFVWAFVILPLGTVFLAGLGTLVGIVTAPIAEGSPFLTALMIVVPLIIGVIIGLLVTAGRAEGTPEVRWDSPAASFRGDFDGGLRIGEEVRWY